MATVSKPGVDGMTVTVERKALIVALNAARAATWKFTTRPILAYAGLAASADQLSVWCCDGDIRIEHSIAASGAFPPCALPPRVLIRMLQAMQDDAVCIRRRDDGRIEIEGADSSVRFTLQPLDAADMADVVTQPTRYVLDFADAILRGLIDAVGAAISTEETRYYLNGICLDLGGEPASHLRGTATNGHMLESRSVPVIVRQSPGGGATHRVILPHGVVRAARACLAGEVRLEFWGETQQTGNLTGCTISGEGRKGRTTITAMLIDGTYPDWRLVVPEPVADGFEVEASVLRRMARLARAGGDAFMVGGMAFVPHEGGVGVTLRGSETEFQADLPATILGSPGPFGLSSTYVETVASRIAGRVRVSPTSRGGPVRFCHLEDPEAISIIMPMRMMPDQLVWPPQARPEPKRRAA